MAHSIVTLRVITMWQFDFDKGVRTTATGGSFLKPHCLAFRNIDDQTSRSFLRDVSILGQYPVDLQLLDAILHVDPADIFHGERVAKFDAGSLIDDDLPWTREFL